jgi:hypothetical protein
MIQDEDTAMIKMPVYIKPGKDKTGRIGIFETYDLEIENTIRKS